MLQTRERPQLCRYCAGELVARQIEILQTRERPQLRSRYCTGELSIPYPILPIGGVVQSIKGIVFYLTDGSVNCPHTKDQRNHSH